jgi:phosphopantothenoylcysteine synthetase/decarboxylase
MVVANLVGQDCTGFDADDNEVTLVLRTGESVRVPQASKASIADSILDQALRLRLALHTAQ